MPLSPGTKLGPYEILAPIGAGGISYLQVHLSSPHSGCLVGSRRFGLADLHVRAAGIPNGRLHPWVSPSSLTGLWLWCLVWTSSAGGRRQRQQGN